MANLYQLTESYLMVQQAIEEGEDLDLILESINEAIEDKADNYAKVMKNMDADCKAIESEIERLTERKKILQNGITRMKESLFTNMKAVNKEKFKTELFSFAIVTNGGKAPLIIKDEDHVPKKYLKAVYSIDKEKIRESLDKGMRLKFAEYGERGESLRIR